MMTHASRVVILGQQRRCRGRQTRVAARGRGNNGADAAACKWRGARTRARGVPPCEARLVRLLSERSVPPKERPQPAHDEPRTHAHTPIPPEPEPEPEPGTSMKASHTAAASRVPCHFSPYLGSRACSTWDSQHDGRA
jgi:hypothetical protein